MSDFDREAERERLREKYERDREKRESTQRMSELLLQGATMTNHHCDECGDPIFRYEGQEFCPSCQGVIEGETPEDDATAGNGTAAESASGSKADVTVDPSDESAVGTNPAAETDRDASAAGAADGERIERTPQPRPTERPAPDPADDAATPHEPPEGAGAESGEAAAGGRPAARAALERTMTRFAERAERTEDPREARDLLAAAREAAETLAALDGCRNAR